jgi:hypothetical protein
MVLPRASRARLVWALELSLGLELYACAVLALHARGLRATPLEASLALVLPALVIPPVFYVLVALVIVRPLALVPLIGAVAVMCGLHGFLVAATGALFMIPDLLGYGAAVAFALWGSPAVTLLQLTATPIVFARLRPLVSAPRPPRGDTRAPVTQRRVEAPAMTGAPRQLAPAEAAPAPALHPSAPAPSLRPSTARPVPATAFVSPLRAAAGHSTTSAPSATHTAASAPSTPTAVTRSVVSPLPAATRQEVTKTPPVVAMAEAKSAPATPAEPQRGRRYRSGRSRGKPMISSVRPDRGPAPGRDVRARSEGLKDTLRPGCRCSCRASCPAASG